jgi:hypothetical protein
MQIRKLCKLENYANYKIVQIKKLCKLENYATQSDMGTNGPTDEVSYRDACWPLKTRIIWS